MNGTSHSASITPDKSINLRIGSAGEPRAKRIMPPMVGVIGGKSVQIDGEGNEKPYVKGEDPIFDQQFQKVECSRGHPVRRDRRATNLCDVCGMEGTFYRCASGCEFDLCGACYKEAEPGRPCIQRCTMFKPGTLFAAARLPWFGFGTDPAAAKQIEIKRRVVIKQDDMQMKPAKTYIASGLGWHDKKAKRTLQR